MNDQKAIFSAIYDQYIDKIYRFVYLKVNSQEIAEDLTSEVFVRGWDRFREKGEEIQNLPAFLYQIARNLIVDHYREKGQARFVSTEYHDLIDAGTGLEEKAIRGSDLDRVKTVLSNIKDDYREVIVWHYIDELSIPEIAKMLKKSEEAVRVLLHRALKSLKNQLKQVG